jgi:hypothetical protein
MGNIISILQEIFLLKEDNASKVGLTGLKEEKTPVERPKVQTPEPKELRISDLMRKGSF